MTIDEIIERYTNAILDIYGDLMRDDLATETRQELKEILNLLKSGREALREKAAREKAARENPQPLTLDELRQMDGQLVWTHTTGLGHNYRCEIVDGVEPGPDDREVIRMCCLSDGVYDIFADLYGKTWIAYRYLPKEVQ